MAGYKEGERVKISPEHGQAPGEIGVFKQYTVAVVVVNGEPIQVGVVNLSPAPKTHEMDFTERVDPLNPEDD